MSARVKPKKKNEARWDKKMKIICNKNEALVGKEKILAKRKQFKAQQKAAKQEPGNWCLFRIDVLRTEKMQLSITMVFMVLFY